MAVIHVLKDGSVVKDITGHVVQVADAELLYRLINDLNAKRSGNEKRVNEEKSK